MMGRAAGLSSALADERSSVKVPCRDDGEEKGRGFVANLNVDGASLVVLRVFGKRFGDVVRRPNAKLYLGNDSESTVLSKTAIYPVHL